MKRGVKIFLSALLAIFLIFIVFFVFFPKQEEHLKIVFFDVGQGDAVFIKTPSGQKILIDGGPDNSVLTGLGKNLAWWDRKIDLMILTHPHDDHITGLIEVLKRYAVGKIFYTGVSHSAPNYLKWLEIIKEKKTSFEIINGRQKIFFNENCFLEIIYPNKDFLNNKPPSLNNSSIVARLVYGQNSFLFTGDIENEVEEELLESGVDLKADVLKASHHGSDTSSGEKFLSAVNPKIVIILVGADNSFGHPSLLTLKRMERMGIEIFRSDLDGEIELISDGEEILIKK